MNTTGAQVKFSTMLHKSGQAASLGMLAALLIFPSSVSAQTGISEADVIQQEEEEETAGADEISTTERDARAIRPTLNLTAPGVDGEYDDAVLYTSDFVEFQLRAASRMISIANPDFRALGPTNDNTQDIIDSDDRRTFGANNAVLNVAFTPNDSVALKIAFRHNALWGGGKFNTLNSDNVFFMDNLFFEWTPLRTDLFELTTRFGRQYYEIGGASDFGGARRDYFFWDLVDGVTIDVGLGMAGKLRVLAVDMAGAQFRPDEVDFYTRANTGSPGINYQGQANTLRHGLVYENTQLLDGLEVRAFGFYANVGAGSSRADGTAGDLCYSGQLCNYTDNDYSWMAGGRVGYFFDNEEETFKVGAYGEFARSGGIDRKDTRVGLRDVSLDGNAFGGGLLADVDLGSIDLSGAFQYFRADGPSYGASDGILFNHGFVGFKGAHVGGGMVDDTMGWHPSAYVSATNGVLTTPQDQDRKSGMQSLYAGLQIGVLDVTTLSLGVWSFKDAGNSNLSEDDQAAVARDLPFGYTLADLLAQNRLGKSLGTELDAGLSIKANDKINVFGQGGLFMPGEFFEGELSRTGGTALGSDDPVNAWMVTGGVSIELR